MKLWLGLIGIMLVSSFSLSVNAEGHKEAWVETSLDVEVEVPISHSLGVQALGSWLLIPSANESIFFAYVGPRVEWLPRNQLWSMIRIGILAGWMEDGSEGLIASFASGGWIFDRRLSARILIDGYFGKVQRDVYGLYMADVHPIVHKVNVGFQAEHMNTDVIQGGPHVGVTADRLHLEVQYFVDPFNRARLLRCVTSLSF